jgi:hypothetical protein
MSTGQEHVDTMERSGLAASVVGVQSEQELGETQYWLSQVDILEAVEEARREIGDDGGLTEDQIRRRFES